jgi:mxaJ protein
MRLLLTIAVVSAAFASDELRVCADPNNLPFSNNREQGFENRIVRILAQEMHRRVVYTWWAQRRGFVRNTLNAHTCDLIPGIAEDVDSVSATRPYYRSTYVFVSRRDHTLGIDSFDSPQLRASRIGVQIIGDDYTNTPPVQALARRGIVNVRGYRVTGDYSQPNPPAKIMNGVAAGEVDVAIVWGPLAGYFATRAGVPLSLVPVAPSVDMGLPMTYEIAMGVRHGDDALKAEVNRALSARHREIDAVLQAFHVPRVAKAGKP